MKDHNKCAHHYLPVFQTKDGSKIAFLDIFSDSENEARSKNATRGKWLAALTGTKRTSQIYKTENKSAHLVRLGKFEAIVISGPMFDKILALKHHSDVEEGIEQSL